MALKTTYTGKGVVVELHNDLMFTPFVAEDIEHCFCGSSCLCSGWDEGDHREIERVHLYPLNDNFIHSARIEGFNVVVYGRFLALSHDDCETGDTIAEIGEIIEIAMWACYNTKAKIVRAS